MFREFLINTGMLKHLFFKRRYVLSINEAKSISGPADLTIHQTIPTHGWDSLRQKRDPAVLEEWSKHSDMVLVLAVLDGDIVGYGWLLIPDTVLWHDKILVYPDEALLFDAYVKPNYRRQGVYGQLHATRRSIGLDNAERVITVVESRNNASLSANISFGMKKLSTNYLVKFFGINFLSIERGGRSHISVHIDVPNKTSIKRQFTDPS